MATQWFEVQVSNAGEADDETVLRAALWTAGHDARWIREPDGRIVLAARIHGPEPARELVRLLHQAGLTGYLAPLSS